MNDSVEAVSGAACWIYISVPFKDIIASDKISRHSTSDKLSGGIQGCTVGGTILSHTGEGSYEADSNGYVVIGSGMSSKSCPTTTFIYSSIFSNKEVVSDVTPFLGVHVIILYVPDLSAARSW